MPDGHPKPHDPSEDARSQKATGKYTPFASLGKGGMADVYLAAARGPIGFNKLVVLKRMRNPEDKTGVRMFLDEARLSARLSHPNIVHTYEVGEVNGRYFIAMEYLDGQSVDSVSAALAAASREMSDLLIAHIVAQALKGLHYAHELTDYDGTPLGIVHRDCSPHNLFICYSGQTKVLDFGIAKAALNVTQTETGVLKGKIRYMSPEQVGGAETERRADIFSMGVVLWELLARRKLYEGDTVTVLQKVASEEAPKLRTVRPETSPVLEEIVHRALQRVPALRYATAELMQADLEAFLRSQDTAVKESEIGSLVASLFAVERQEVRQRIKKFLALVPGIDDSTQGEFRFDSDGEILPPLLGGSNDELGNAKRNLASSSYSQPRVESPPDAHVRTRWPWVIAASLAILATVVGASVLGRRTAAPIVPVAHSAPASSVAAQVRVRARVSSDPPGALLEWDGRPFDRTPALVDLPGAVQTLVVTREGYDSQSVMLVAKEDGSIDERLVTLRRSAPGTATAPDPAAGASPADRRIPESNSQRRPLRPTRVSVPAAPPAVSAAKPRPRIRVLGDGEPSPP